MSCHDIGRGINTITQQIFKEYDEGTLSQDVAKRLISTSRKAVNWCDGNEDEAVGGSWSCRCGNCLRKMEEGEQLYSAYNGTLRWSFLDSKIRSETAFPSFCSSCVQTIFPENAEEILQSVK